jgi:transposase
MTITIGVDVSKSFLDVADSLSKSVRRFDNSDSGVAALLDAYSVHSLKDLRIVMESTGHYQYRLQHAATERNIIGYVVNPYRVRQFALASGKRAKTDRIDAHIICSFGQTMDLKSMFKRSAAEMMLGDFLKTRTCLKTQLTTLSNHRSTYSSDIPNAFLDPCIDHIKLTICDLETQIRQLIASESDLKERFTLLTSAPAIGEVCAWTLIAFLPELGHVSRSEIAALVGVAPWVKESGNCKGRSMISGGRKVIRDTLYMGVMGSICHKRSKWYLYHQRFLNSGKPFKVSVIACLRKLLTHLNCMIRDNQMWHD